MAGLLSIVNPRRRRRKTARRKTHARKVTRRRRRRVAVAVASNPRRRRRVARRGHSSRRVHARRRRTHNPRMGGMVGTLTKGLAIGAGAYLSEVGAAAINGYLMKDKPLTGLAKTGAKAAVGLIALPMLLKFIPGARKYAGAVALGAGVVVALDLLNEYLTPKLPAEIQSAGVLKGYGDDQISGYENTQISGNGSDTGIYGSIY